MIDARWPTHKRRAEAGGRSLLRPGSSFPPCPQRNTYRIAAEAAVIRLTPQDRATPRRTPGSPSLRSHTRTLARGLRLRGRWLSGDTTTGTDRALRAGSARLGRGRQTARRPQVARLPRTRRQNRRHQHHRALAPPASQDEPARQRPMDRAGRPHLEGDPDQRAAALATPLWPRLLFAPPNARRPGSWTAAAARAFLADRDRGRVPLGGLGRRQDHGVRRRDGAGPVRLRHVERARFPAREGSCRCSSGRKGAPPGVKGAPDALSGCGFLSVVKNMEACEALPVPPCL